MIVCPAAAVACFLHASTGLGVDTSAARQQETDRDWRKVEPGLQLSFPADHGAHPEYQTEWWYLTGDLADDSGERFGFQFTLFRRGLEAGAPAEGASPLRARQAFAGHLVVNDVAGARTILAERLRRGGTPLAGARNGELEIHLDDWSLVRGPDDGLRLSASDAARGIGLELELHPAKPLVLHGERGYSRKGSRPENATAYVSWTRLAARGTLELEGRARAVAGEAWFDHEFGTTVLEEGLAGWDWFGLRLDDGRELMVFTLRREAGAPAGLPAPVAAGTLVERDGTARALAARDFTLEVRERWTSPSGGAAYPSRWRLALPGAGLELEIAPLVADCELHARSTGTTYWEGPVAVTGSVTGRGHAELTGYAGTMSGRF
jgi:predicted secreted hydrolase